MRLIDGDAFIEMMEEKCDPESTLDPWVLRVCRGGVKIMPTVDAVPVKHGRWKRNKNDTYSCSECHSWIPNEQKYYANFCLYCGADMREKQ